MAQLFLMLRKQEIGMGVLSSKAAVPKERVKARKKFLYYFPKGFAGEKYKSWERDYKWDAHLEWEEQLNRTEFKRLLLAREYEEVSLRAVRIETKTNLLFSFEKMALRDAVKSPRGAKDFALSLFEYVYGDGLMQSRFEQFALTLSTLPRKQTRVLTWPLQTVFGFIAAPDVHMFLKPTVTKIAARKYGFDFYYNSKPNWATYQSLMEFAAQVKKDMADLKPVDYIDLQSFIWVQGSEEYPD
jgi:hypothetical protein